MSDALGAYPSFPHLCTLISNCKATIRRVHAPRPAGARASSTAGFTLIELLVVLSIMLVITSTFLVRNQRFNSSILLRSLAYQVALSVREAQVYGVGVKEVAVGSGNFSSGFGVYFSNGMPTSYLLFADTNNNGLYDGGDTVIETFTIGRGFTLSQFCATTTTSGGVQQCSPSSISALSITFRRPNPEPTIRTNLSGYTYSSASITVSSASGSTRTVTVGAAGEIEVQQTGN